MMTIQELLLDVGLPLKEIGLLLHDIKTYNVQHPEKLVPDLKLKGPIDLILLIQLPFIERAIARVKGDNFLNSGGKFPLSIDENALRYAAYKLDKYFGKS
ncbi:hypothetical protein [Mucilaginibacter lacusdianchii]|uniref:hypothetical protein n=1 Tax=Mucilaginibacter lacusdianchii TaxID=2684211 RepID=UPI00131D7C05|nr:hypothetical protein [Mucilaginibacter sp. JXJ CY 39]